jgi:ABC-type transporter Mla subunit MlaD
MIERGRLTERITPALLRLELRRSARPLIVLAIGIVVAVYCGQYILSHIRGGVGPTHAIHLDVADATGVVPGRAEVRFKGIQAGVVGSVGLSGGHRVIVANVADKFGPIYRNAEIVVRPNTALQDMYVDIVNRGTPAARIAGSGYVFPRSQTQTPVNVADVLDAFDPAVRAHLYDVLDQLGNGLQDRGAMLRRAFMDVGPLLSAASRMSAQLARRGELTRQLVHNTSVLSQVLARRTGQLRTLLISGSDTLAALSNRDGTDLEATLRRLPPTFDAISGSFSAVDRLLPDLNDALIRLAPVANALPSSLHALRSLSASADPALRALRTPVTKLVPFAVAIPPVAGQLGSALRLLAPQVADISHVTDDLVECPQVPYAFFNWTASLGKYIDTYGSIPRGDIAVGLDSTTVLKDPNIVPAKSCAGGTTIGSAPTR